MRLLVLRPEPGASATGRRIQAMGGEAAVEPLFAIRSVAWSAPDPAAHDALLLTSANGARHAGEALKSLVGLPVYAVGGATAAAARKAGLTVAGTGDQDGASLLELAFREGVRRPLHLTGADHVGATHPGLDITRVVVYRAEAIGLSAAATQALEEGATALLHSPRAAATFRDAVEAAGIDRGQVQIAAISPATAHAAGEGWRAVVVAARPADDALLAAAASLCETGRNRQGRAGV